MLLQSHTEAYIKCLEEIVLLWIKSLAARRPYIWHQDSVPWHTSKRTQFWLLENSCNHINSNIWLLNSPDCSFFDHYIWGTVKWETNKTLCNTIDELKARITAAFTNLNKLTIGKFCNTHMCIKRRENNWQIT